MLYGVTISEMFSNHHRLYILRCYIILIKYKYQSTSANMSSIWGFADRYQYWNIILK